jgi:ribosome-binding factor A
MSSIRQQRLAEMLFQELTILIGHEMEDPRLPMITVTNVAVSKDLRNVNVHVSHDDDTVSRRDVLMALRHATPFVRRQIAQRCSLRVAPEVSFHYDDLPEKAARVDELLRLIAQERTQPAGDVPAGAPAQE